MRLDRRFRRDPLVERGGIEQRVEHLPAWCVDADAVSDTRHGVREIRHAHTSARGEMLAQVAHRHAPQVVDQVERAIFRRCIREMMTTREEGAHAGALVRILCECERDFAVAPVNGPREREQIGRLETQHLLMRIPAVRRAPCALAPEPELATVARLDLDVFCEPARQLGLVRQGGKHALRRGREHCGEFVRELGHGAVPAGRTVRHGTTLGGRADTGPGGRRQAAAPPLPASRA